MKWYVEHRPHVNRIGKIKMIDVTETSNYYGFRSVYAFSEDVAEQIIASNSTSGLHGHVLYSDMLLMDFDDCPQAAEKFRAYLINEGYNYEMLDSGNRSIHFHIPLSDGAGNLGIADSRIPRAQKAWVKEHAPKADTSFYHPAGMYRLTGTYHYKNPGHCKHSLIKHTSGQNLILVDYLDNSAIPLPVTRVDDDQDYYFMLARLLQMPIDEGGRNYHLWKIIKTCSKLNFSSQRTLSEALYWNATKAHPPLDERVAFKITKEVYGNQVAEGA